MTPDRALLTIVAARLEALALQTHDIALARSLLASAKSFDLAHVDQLSELAARGASVRLESNTVGLFLSLGSTELERRSAEAAVGVASGLGHPGGKARIVSRDDGRDPSQTEDALSLLVADGAAVIVTGTDQKSADRALAFGSKTGIPMILLRRPSAPLKAGGAVFVVGEDLEAGRAAIVERLGPSRFGSIAMLVSERTSDMPKGVVAVQPCGASLDFVRASGARALFVEGSPGCARDAAGSTDVTIALGLDAGSAVRRGLTLSAGRFPSWRGAPARLGSGADALEASWWSGLGHDAGALVKDAIADLPADTDPKERARLVTTRIERATADLWTTDAHGFEGKRILNRKIEVVEAPTAR